MAKLGDQFKKISPSSYSTRTQRVARKQAVERLQREEQEFEDLKKRAKEIQESEFGEVSTIEEYQQKYNLLDPSLKQFFSTPKEVQSQRLQDMENTKTKVQEKISYADQKLQEAKDKLKAREEKYDKLREYYRNQNLSSERYKKKVRQLKENLYEDENEYEEESAYWRGFKEGLQKSIGELAQGKFLSYKDIENYADSIGNYKEGKTRARNEQREFNYKFSNTDKELKEQGYKPIVVEKSFKGKPEEAYITYINTDLGKSKQVAKFKPSGIVDTSKLSKSQLGVVPISRSLQFAGKEFKYTSNLQLYTGKDGKLTTQFGSVGLTEQEVLKQARDEQYKEFQKSISEKPYLDKFKVLEVGGKTEDNKNVWKELRGYGGDLPYGYGGQQTISDQPTNVVISLDQYYSQRDQPSFMQWATKPLKKLPNGEWFLNLGSPVGINTFSTGIAPYKISDDPYKSISITEGIKTTREDLGELATKIKKWALGSDKIEKVEEDLKDKYTNIYQTEFERKYMKDLIYDDLDFEKAQEEFEKSEEAKIIQEKYGEEFKDEMVRLKREAKGGRKVLAYAGIGSLNLASGLYGTIETPKSTVITAGAVYGGIKVLKAVKISKIVSTGLTAGFGVYGLKKTLDPTSTIEEASSGFVTAVLSGAILGYQGYKYLRQPMPPTYEKIKVPLKEYKAKKIIGFEDPNKAIIKVNGKHYLVDKTIYNSQKLSTQIIEGRRTIITSKGRALFNKYANYEMTGVKLKNIYEGVPYVDKAGYSTALKRLQKYGLTSAQAKATLRYYQPKVIDTTLKKGQITTIQGDKVTARGEFDILREQKKIILDKDLGITTRYAKPKIDYYDFERSLTNIKGKDFIQTDITKTSAYAPIGKQIVRIKELSQVNVGKLKKGYVNTAYGKGIKEFQQYEYTDVKNVFGQQQIMPLKRKLFLGRGETRIVKLGNNRIIDIDLDEIRGISKTEGVTLTGKKTPLSKTFGVEEAKNLFSVRSNTDLKKVLEKLDDVASGSSAGSTGSAGSRSQYYGTGMYERSSGGLLPQDTTQFRSFNFDNLIQQPKVQFGSVITPQISGISMGALTSVGVASTLKSQDKMMSGLRTNFGLKDIIKSRSITGLKSDQAVKQASSLKSSATLKSQLTSLGVNVNVTSPIFKTPPIPRFNFRPPKPIFFFGKEKLEKKLRRKKKSVFDLGYLPDFTSRAIGLDPEIITEKQAQARVRKIMSGFELRRPVIVK